MFSGPPTSGVNGGGDFPRGNVNLAGVPAHMRAALAARFNGLGAADDGVLDESSTGGASSSFDADSFAKLLKGLQPILDSAGKLLNPATANPNLPTLQTNLTAAQIAALQAQSSSSWKWPLILAVGALVVGGGAYYALKR
jgi:hypothetical protein